MDAPPNDWRSAGADEHVQMNTNGEFDGRSNLEDA